MSVRFGGTLVGGRAFVAALAAIVFAIAAATAAPVAKANGTCGGHTITNTMQTSYGSNEKVVIDVWGSSAPHPSSVVIGGGGGGASPPPTHSPPNTSVLGAPFPPPGTWELSLSGGGALLGDG